jgi:hypothetical protein
MDQNGTKKAPNNIEVHGGLKAMNGNIIVAQQQHGTQEPTKIKIKVARPQLDLISTFH